MKDNVVREKTFANARAFAFALRVVKLAKFLQEEKREFVLSKQVLRSGTAIGALVREAEFAVSDGFVVTMERKLGTTLAGQPESQPQSLEVRVLSLLVNEPLSKSELSSRLGHKAISGRLNEVVRLLLAERNIEMTIPDKPNSRLQKYRLTTAGAARLNLLRKGGND